MSPPNQELPLFAAEAEGTTFKCPDCTILTTVKRNAVVVDVRPAERHFLHRFFANVFATFDLWRLSVDSIATSASCITVSLWSEMPLVKCISEEKYEIVDKNLYHAIQDLHRYGAVDLAVGMAIVSGIDGRIRNSAFATSISTVLGRSNINISMLSQGEL
ncbi:ATP-dependent DNA helicase PIF1 [Purpureocillium lavendulum]|uniref:ATP-dependent DNA helicase PIF1 n=1 Tax=Purpureocillium lavendulum TaxID=1247861 RepID=A0AB34FGG6_9HYPO|nr:ATP-dependent DNA helicase PIF1 [Purpureocillium lavendulum]